MSENLSNINLLEAVNVKLEPQGFKGIYGCMIEFQSESKMNFLKFKYSYEYLGNKNYSGHIFKINRFKDIYINDKSPQNFIEDISIEVSETLYPLEVQCNHSGGFKTIRNFDEIKKRWHKKKKSLLSKYRNESVIKYINVFDKSMSFEELFIEKMRNDFFLSLYFQPIFKYYTAFYKIESTLKFPIVGTSKQVCFKVNQRLDENHLKENEYRIIMDGEIEDERSLTDLEQKLDYPIYNSDSIEDKGNCQITYQLNNISKIIEGIYAEFNLNFGNTRKVVVKMFLLE
ncbi:hypothetical protein [Cellulophaga baltica]|uniref:hypothetical protein n=1 Tax=Cellulophaga baltica TaxID=76594 RepID=UPI0015F4088D|nr:hypothetical protein [Cellulophaga baltica]MBA6316568.1 hypothetical protein [Cellulophaga baltica]